MNKDMEMLCRNTKMVENYIRETIMPCLEESVCVEFGGKVHRGRCDERYEDKFELHVGRNDLFGVCGGLTMLIDNKSNPRKENEWKVNRCGWIFIYSDSGYGAEFMESLLLEWQSIKMMLNTAVQKERDKRFVLEHFVL